MQKKRQDEFIARTVAAVSTECLAAARVPAGLKRKLARHLQRSIVDAKSAAAALRKTTLHFRDSKAKRRISLACHDVLKIASDAYGKDTAEVARVNDTSDRTVRRCIASAVTPNF